MLSKQEIDAEVEATHLLSLDYRVADVVLACGKLLADIYKKYKEQKIEELVAEKNAIHDNNERYRHTLEYDIRSLTLSRGFQIYIEYSKSMDKDAGRAILSNNNQIIITIPDILRQNAIRPDGIHNREGLKVLDKRIAHELAHIVLHTDEFLGVNGTQGTLNIGKKSGTKKEKEEEANLFAKKLLELRYSRIEKLKAANQCECF